MIKFGIRRSRALSDRTEVRCDAALSLYLSLILSRVRIERKSICDVFAATINEAERCFRFADNLEVHSEESVPLLPRSFYLCARFRKNVARSRMYRDTPDLRANTGSTTRNRARRISFRSSSFFLAFSFTLVSPFFFSHFPHDRRRVI